MAGRKIEKAFSETASLIFAEPLAGIDRHGEWLFSEMPGWREAKAKGKTVVVPAYAVFPYIPDAKVASMDDADEVSGIRLGISQPSAAGLASQMGSRGAFITDLAEGRNFDVEKCSIYKDLSAAYKCLDCFYSKYLAFSWFCDRNDHIFGCQFTFFSQFCIKCSYSSDLARCLEMDSCSKCSDCLFCHNCEGLRNCMFCFNANNLSYAVANVVVGKEKFMKLRSELLARMVSELKEKQKCSLSVYEF